MKACTLGTLRSVRHGALIIAPKRCLVFFEEAYFDHRHPHGSFRSHINSCSNAARASHFTHLVLYDHATQTGAKTWVRMLLTIFSEARTANASIYEPIRDGT